MMGSRRFLAVVAALAFPSAFATNSQPPSNPSHVSAEASAIGIGGAGGAGGSAHANATGGAGGSASASQTQVAEGGAGGAGGDASNSGLSQSVNFEDRRQAPGLGVPSVFASGPCAYGWSAGVSVPGGAIGGSKAKADPNCDRREAARILLSVNPALALKVLCADPYVKEVATEADCIYAEPEPLTFVDPTLFATKEELADVRQDSQVAIERAFKQTQKK